MTLLEKAQHNRTTSKGTVALIVAALGAVAIACYYVWGPRDLRGMDAALLFVVIAFAAYGTTESIIRGALTVAAVYLSTAMAGTFYAALTPYSRSLLNALAGLGLASPAVGNSDLPALALSFALAAGALWMILELLFRAALPGARLALLGFVDRVGGAVLYLALGVIVAALLFRLLGMGAAGRTAYSAAVLRPEFNRVTELVYQTQSFWFAGRPPVVYTYDGILHE